MAACPAADDLAGKGRQPRELHIQRVAGLVDADGATNGVLPVVPRPVLPSLRSPPPKVGAVDLGHSRQPMRLFALCHGRQNLVAHQLGDGVARADLAIQCQRRLPRLGLVEVFRSKLERASGEIRSRGRRQSPRRSAVGEPHPAMASQDGRRHSLHHPNHSKPTQP